MIDVSAGEVDARAIMMASYWRSACSAPSSSPKPDLVQQLAAFARNGQRPRIVAADQLFWLALRRLWLRWSDVLVFVKPDTVVRWHRASFRRYWTWLSRRRRPGRPPIDARLRALIQRMALENPTWGAPRIHGELRMLGFEVSERSVSRCLPRRRPPPGALERWLTF